MTWVRFGWLGAASAAVLVLGGCGGSASAQHSPAKAGTAKITAFDVPGSVACGGKTSAPVAVTWATSGAAKVQLDVDGALQPAVGASGSANVPVHCDPLPHTVVLVATDSAGHRSSRQKLVNTTTP